MKIVKSASHDQEARGVATGRGLVANRLPPNSSATAIAAELNDRGYAVVERRADNVIE